MKTASVKSKVAPHTATSQKEQQQSKTSSSGTADQIAIAAYFKAEARGFEPGYELEDWLAAEREVH